MNHAVAQRLTRFAEDAAANGRKLDEIQRRTGIRSGAIIRGSWSKPLVICETGGSRMSDTNDVHLHLDGELSPEDAEVLRDTIAAANRVTFTAGAAGRGAPRAGGFDPQRLVDLAKNLRWVTNRGDLDPPAEVALWYSNHDDRYGAPCWFVETPDRLRHSGFTPEQAIDAAEKAAARGSLPGSDAGATA